MTNTAYAISAYHH